MRSFQRAYFPSVWKSHLIFLSDPFRFFVSKRANEWFLNFLIFEFSKTILEHFLEFGGNSIKKIKQRDVDFRAFWWDIRIEMRVITLIDKEPLRMPGDMIIHLLRRLEIHIIVISHQPSVVGNRIIPWEVEPFCKINIWLQLPKVHEFFFFKGLSEGVDVLAYFWLQLPRLLAAALIVGG